MKPQTSVVLAATKVMSEACCLEFSCFASMVWERGRRNGKTLTPGRAYTKVGLREAEKDAFNLALKTIIHLCAFNCLYAWSVDKRLIFDNFILNVSLWYLDKSLRFCEFLCFIFLLTEYVFLYFSSLC